MDSWLVLTLVVKTWSFGKPLIDHVNEPQVRMILVEVGRLATG